MAPNAISCGWWRQVNTPNLHINQSAINTNGISALFELKNTVSCTNLEDFKAPDSVFGKWSDFRRYNTTCVMWETPPDRGRTIRRLAKSVLLVSIQRGFAIEGLPCANPHFPQLLLHWKSAFQGSNASGRVPWIRTFNPCSGSGSAW